MDVALILERKIMELFVFLDHFNLKVVGIPFIPALNFLL